MKKILINFLLTFCICFIVHFVYTISKNNLFAIFFPVNESIWEHMKMLYTSILISGFILYLINKTNNNFISSFITGIFSICFYLLVYLPFNSANKILIFTVLIIDIILSEILRNYLINKKELFKYDKYFIPVIIISYIVFGYLTYNPPIADLFKDKTNNTYGLNIHEI